MKLCCSMLSLFWMIGIASAFAPPIILAGQDVSRAVYLYNHVDDDSSLEQQQQQQQQQHQGAGFSRRHWLASSGTTTVAALAAAVASSSSFWMIDPSIALAVDVTTTTKMNLMEYQDLDCKFTMQVPSEWTKTIQSLPDRRKIVLFLDPSDQQQKTLLFIAYTPVRDDFTSLGSFGSVDEVAYATILPKAELAMVEGVSSKMLATESRKQAYYFDYVQTVPQQPETHFRTIFTLVPGATGGAGNVLVTITVQTPEAEYATLKPIFDDIVNSFNNKV